MTRSHKTPWRNVWTTVLALAPISVSVSMLTTPVTQYSAGCTITQMTTWTATSGVKWEPTVMSSRDVDHPIRQVSEPTFVTTSFISTRNT